MLEWYVKEFCAICGACLGKHGTRKGEFVSVDKAKLIEMLEKNGFETAFNKLKIWRNLRWIDADNGHYTRNVTLNSGEKRKRLVKLSLLASETLKELLNEQNVVQTKTAE